jgi:hypothetical protein
MTPELSGIFRVLSVMGLKGAFAMFFVFLALLVGILVGIILLVVIFSLLTMAQRADAQAEQGFGMGWEGGWEDSQTRRKKVQTNQEPIEELVRLTRMSHPGLPH